MHKFISIIKYLEDIPKRSVNPHFVLENIFLNFIKGFPNLFCFKASPKTWYFHISILESDIKGHCNVVKSYFSRSVDQNWRKYLESLKLVNLLTLFLSLFPNVCSYKQSCQYMQDPDTVCLFVYYWHNVTEVMDGT